MTEEAVEDLGPGTIVTLEVAPSQKALLPPAKRSRHRLLCGIAACIAAIACSVGVPLILFANQQSGSTGQQDPVTSTALSTAAPPAYCPWKTGRPKFPHEKVPGLDLPASVSDDGTLIKQELNYSDGNASIQLYYEARLIQDWTRIVALDLDERVVGASCDGQGLLTMSFALDVDAASELIIDAAEAASMGVNQSIVTGSYAFGCTCEELGEGSPNTTTDTYCTIQHKVAEVVSVDAGSTAGSSTVRVRLVSAAYTEIFESVKLYYISAPTANETGGGDNDDDQPDYAEEPDEISYIRPSGSGAPPSSRRGLLFGWIGGLWNRLWGFIGSFLNFLDHSLRSTVRVIATFITTGNLQGSQSLSIATWRWFPPPGGRPAGFPLDLSGSSASWNIGVRLELDVRSWSLERLEVAAFGRASLRARARFLSSVRYSPRSWTVLQSTPVGPPVVFAIGPVPIKMQARMRMSASVELSATANGGSMTTSSTASAHTEYGIRASRGFWGLNWDRISSSNFEHRREATTLSLPTSIEASAVVSLNPTLYLSINWIGGPTVTLVPYIAAEFEADPTDGWFSNPHCGATVGTGVNAYVGAEINIASIIQHTLFSLRVLSSGPHRLWNCDCSAGCSWA